MDTFESKKKKAPYLVLSLATNLGLLFSFKYFDFFSESLNFISSKMNLGVSIPTLDWILPIGISFYTFQTLSYTLDVYFGRQKAEKHFGYFALFVSYFPQLVAGPIERYSDLSTQLKEKKVFTYENLANGLRMVLYGLFIKMVIADNLSGYVDAIYKDPLTFHSLAILNGFFFYSFQIYCDFLGYSTVAVGSAMIMGVNLMENFKTPYFAKSISEFWQRWHISLSTWFRDYLYIPLGGKRSSKLKWAINILIVFLISGAWHGANWTFIIWGFSFAVVYLLEKTIFAKDKPIQQSQSFNLIDLLKVLFTFSIVTFNWVWFRSPTFEVGIEMFSTLFNSWNSTLAFLETNVEVWFFLFLFLLGEIILYNRRFDYWISKRNFGLRWGIYSFLIFSILVFSGTDNFPFIYFRF